MKISPKWSRIYTHWYANTLLKQQVAYLEIGLFDEMRDQEFNLLLSETVGTFFLLGPKGRKFCDSDVLPVLPFLLTTFECEVDNFIQIMN